MPLSNDKPKLNHEASEIVIATVRKALSEMQNFPPEGDSRRDSKRAFAHGKLTGLVALAKQLGVEVPK